MSESGLMRAGGVVVLSGPALKTALECALAAIRASRPAGRSPQAYEALACELAEAMSAAGQLDVRSRAVSKTAAVEQPPPTVPIADAAVRLKLSLRQATRIAPQIGGKKIVGRWFVDELALREHIEGRQ